VPLGLCLYGSAQVFFILYAVVAGALVLLYIGLSYVYDDSTLMMPYVPSTKGSKPFANKPRVSGAKMDTAPVPGTNNDAVEAINVEAPPLRANGVDIIEKARKTFKPTVDKTNGVETADRMAPISRPPAEKERTGKVVAEREWPERERAGEGVAEKRVTGKEESGKQGTGKVGEENNWAENTGAEDKTSDFQNRARKSRAARRLSVKSPGKPVEQDTPSTVAPTSTRPASSPAVKTGPGDYPKPKTKLAVSIVSVHKDDMQPQERRDKGLPSNNTTALPEIRIPKPEARNKEELVDEEAETSSAKTESDTESQHNPDPQLELDERPISNITTITTPQEAPEPAKKKKRLIRKKPSKKAVAAPPANDKPTISKQQPHDQVPSRLSSWDDIPEHYRLDGDETDGQSVSSYLWDAGSAHRRAFALRHAAAVSETAHLPGVLEVPPVPSQQPQARSSEDGEGEAGGDKVEAADADAHDAKDDVKANMDVVSQAQPQPQSRRGSVVVPAAVIPRAVPETNARASRELRRVGPAPNGYAQALADMYKDMKRRGPEVLPGFVSHVAANDDWYLRPGGRR
jgi:hypothetical protein